MKVLRSSDRTFFSPPGSDAKVSILVGKNPEHGSREKHSLSVVHLPPDAQLDEHFHEEREESYLVLAGSGTVTIDGTVVAIGPGDLVSVSPGERHRLMATEAQSLEYVVVTAPAWTKEDVHR
jgi:mannose-6-phosphate isomerase-like protein (cupin superfamily)